MINSTWKLATILGVAGAIAMSAASAEARGGRNAADARDARGVYAYQPSDPHVRQPSGPFAFEPSDPRAQQPSYRGSYNYLDSDSTGYSGSGTFSDGRQVPGTNWNPNQ